MNYKKIAVAFAGGLVGKFAGFRLYEFVRSYSEREAALHDRTESEDRKIIQLNIGEPFEEQPDMLFE
jgi:hypothetical protein